VTLEQMGLFDRLSGHNKVSWHWRVPQGATALDMQKESRTAEIYISSVNGIAETGEIINIDGRCNRVAETLYGHEKVILIAGANKIAKIMTRRCTAPGMWQHPSMPGGWGSTRPAPKRGITVMTAAVRTGSAAG